MLDEWDDAEGAEISRILDFMVDFRLNDEGDLELAEFGESCRDTILKKAYPRLPDAIETAPVTPSGGTTAEGKVMVRKAVQEEQTRPLKPTRLPSARNRGGQSTSEEDGCLRGIRESSVKEMASDFLDKAPHTGRKQYLQP